MQPLDHFDPAHTTHTVIGDYEVEAVPVGRLQPLEPIGYSHDLVPFLAQGSSDKSTDRGFVVEDQDAGDWRPSAQQRQPGMAGDARKN